MEVLNGDSEWGLLYGNFNWGFSRRYLRGLTWFGDFAWGFYMGILHGGFN